MKKIKTFLTNLVVMLFLLSSCQIKLNSSISSSVDKVRQLVHINVLELPFKLDYQINEELDLSGGKIVLYYDDKSEQTLAMTKAMLVTQYQLVSSGSRMIELAYQLNNISMTTSFMINVHPRYIPVTALEIFGYGDEVIISNTMAAFQLYAMITPTDAVNQKHTWKSLHSDVASIDEQGLVTIHQPGTTIIEVSSNDNPLLKDYLSLRVVDQAELNAISALISLFHNFYNGINISRYTSDNFEKIKAIYEQAMLDLNRSYDQVRANAIYLLAYQQINAIPKIVVYYEPYTPTVIPPTFEYIAPNLVILAAGLFNPSVIGVSSVENLTISSRVGDGDVTIEGISVTGQFIIEGGGEDTVTLINVNTILIEINKDGGEPVHLVISGGTHQALNVLTQALLDLNADFSNVTIGDLNEILINGTGEIENLVTEASIVLGILNVNNILIAEHDHLINLEISGLVNHLENHNFVILSGEGIINQALAYGDLEVNLMIKNLIIPCDCPELVTIINHHIINNLEVLKGNVTITGDHAIGYVTLIVAEEEIVYLNTPDTIFRVISGKFDINGFIFFMIAENATDQEGNFTSVYCFGVYRTLVLNKLNDLKVGLNPKVYNEQDFYDLVADIDNYIDELNIVETILEIQAIDFAIPNIKDPYPEHEYIVEIIDFMVMDELFVYKLGDIVYLRIATEPETFNANYGFIYYKNNLDEINPDPIKVIIKSGFDPVIDLFNPSNPTIIEFEIEALPVGVLNPDAIDMAIQFVVTEPSVHQIEAITPFMAMILFDGSNEVQLNVKIYDQFDQEIIAEVIFSLATGYDGVMLSEAGLLTITDTTLVGIITVNVESVDDPLVVASYEVTLFAEELVASTLEPVEPYAAMIKYQGDNDTQLVVKVLDQYGNELDGAEVIFSLATGYDGVMLSEAGLLTITDTTLVGIITVNVESVDDPLVVASYEVTLFAEELVASYIVITGDNCIEVKLYSSNSKEYSAIIYDQYDNIFEGIVDWDIDDVTGVELQSNEEMHVVINETATATSVTLLVTYGAINEELVITLTQELQIPTQVFIGGPNSVQLLKNSSVTATYIPTVVDQYGVVMNGVNVTWSLVSPPSGVSVDSGTGIVTLTKHVHASEFTIKLEVSADPSVNATKTVTIVPAP
jgi:hypothetical protein